MATRYIISALTIAIIMAGSIVHAQPESPFTRPQTQTIQSIWNTEKNAAQKERIAEIVNRIDQTYACLYDNIEKGGKLVIFFDPAHGKLRNGQWQGGDATRRTSCTNLPEEYYSIQISRKMYELLSKNRFIEIKTTDDYLDVLKGKSDTYRDIPFSTTVEMADRAGAFIIISEHLNNISVLHKADGRVNLPGIHITRNGYGWKVLRFVKDTYEGFLTLYNKLDASGFSYNYALKLKKTLVSKGFTPNSWGFGAVGDSRFCYFVDFPVSIIYESGFISNPEEEKKLRDPQFIQKLVDSQYAALLETVDEVFGVDISGFSVKKTGDPSTDRIDLLKLARLSVYYIKTGNTASSIRVIREMEKKYSGSKYREHTWYFSSVKNSLVTSCNYYARAQKYKRHKKNKLARKYFWLARRSLQSAPIFAGLRDRYHHELRTTAASTTPAKPATADIKPAAVDVKPVNRTFYTSFIARAPLGRSIILPVEQNQSLETAIQLALDPDEETLGKLVKSFKNGKIVTRSKYYRSSGKGKKKKRVAVWKTKVSHVRFGTGIYIVNLDRNLNIVSARYVSSVPLNPGLYQNQQYLKNSYFSHDTKDRAL
ncbi:MAG TPA: N-acetylmuramoyl-L-alanine amidase [Spirochaetota bacterium]|nr:N-acetylmuramoyl-L-alanine amidase [Spirochaetota bacterium]HOD15338.1 N-acetylmuramoyl-L-alanine amidase [Spirochaetota bacterium]HPN12745.1 N-acetylmuramoyl-L-alanine amidase [Spirochaetota bacterium]HQL80920.1 N-acetylmuramoyl-L-alanine amidase [Spirochaetota bacterium]